MNTNKEERKWFQSGYGKYEEVRLVEDGHPLALFELVDAPGDYRRGPVDRLFTDGEVRAMMIQNIRSSLEFLRDELDVGCYPTSKQVMKMDGPIEILGVTVEDMFEFGSDRVLDAIYFG
jgi:hypothetical protein